ncbi:restriction endonuclease subunit S [Ligilactobacillus salivarius]|uniref:restriction endonuclease subunit S n=1 Tax=Ligilactobacillus salivarius TaxID=1624 RepID=UPI0022E980A9|nr:restriction endonuclease subunit S [Ligilactobacillus salivarius]MDE1524773.1 restriction endonuclease subunit S [Ligilactobacillus salivarius]
MTQDKGVVYRDNLDIDIKYDLSTLKNYKLVQPGDFIISLRSFQGGFETSYLTGITSPAYTIFNFIDNQDKDHAFWQYLFKRIDFINSLKRVTFGIRDGKAISFSQFGDVKVKYPSFDEQKHIATALTKLDNTIQLHEDHLQFLHSFKSFLLQKMFFDNDIPPLLRFNKFTEKWNQCRLNDHTIVTMGQSPNSKNYTNNQTGKILVQGNADLYKNKVLKRVFTTEVTKTAVKNDILISVRAPVGDIARNQYESVVIGRGIASIKGNDFLYYQLEKMKNNGFWNKYIAGSTFESITGKDLKNTKIYTTNSDEERKIGNIFSSLTKIIQLQEHKIDSLKKLKQFLLQNMFI